MRLAKLLLLAATLGAAGCATMTVGWYGDRYANLARYRTYDWGPADALPTGDPRLDNNPLFRDFLEGAVDKHLAARGYELAVSGRPDFYVHYHLNVEQRFEPNTTEPSVGDCAGADCARPLVYEAGTLVLDAIDASTGRLLWRAWAQQVMTGVIDHQDRLERMTDDAVRKMMRTWPPAHPGGVAAAPLASQTRPRTSRPVTILPR